MIINIIFSIFAAIILSFFGLLILGGVYNQIVLGSVWPDKALGTVIFGVIYFFPLTVPCISWYCYKFMTKDQNRKATEQKMNLNHQNKYKEE